MVTSYRCPVCNRIVENKNVDYSYFCKTCNRTTLKVCYSCNEEIEIQGDPITVCPTCGKWLPDLPTSGFRSITKLHWFPIIINSTYTYLRDRANHEKLAEVLAVKGLVTINKEKRKLKGKQYLRDGPWRRAREYALDAMYMGFLERTDEQPYIYSTTPVGRLLIEINTFESEDLATLQSIFVDRLLKLKLLYGKYTYYRSRPLLNTLRIVKDLRDNAIERKVDNLALAFLCRDETTEYNLALQTAGDYSHDFIHEKFFSESDELRRSIKDCLLKRLEQVNLIDSDNNITSFGESILDFYEEKVPVWYEDLSGREEAAKKLISELINNDLIDGDGFEAITEANEFDFDFFYDIPSSKEREGVLNEFCSITSLEKEKAINLLTDLHLKNINNIKNILMENEENIVGEEVFERTISENRKIGSEFESYIKELLGFLGLDVVHYQDDKRFSHVEFSPEYKRIMPGVGEENPDLLITSPFLGLVDPKTDVGIEMHKLNAYEYYAKHSEVEAEVAIIPTKEPLSGGKINDIQDLDKIVVITKEALEKMRNLVKDGRMDKDEVVEFLVGNKEKYIDYELINQKS